MPTKPLDEQAVHWQRRPPKLKKPVVTDSAKAFDPRSGKPIYLFSVDTAAKGNELARSVILGDSGKQSEPPEALDVLF